MNHRLTSWAASLPLCLGLISAAAQAGTELLVNGGFEASESFAGRSSPGGDDDVYLLHVGATPMPGWRVIGGDVSWARDDNPYGHLPSATGGDFLLDLTAYQTTALGGVSQSFATEIGRRYDVSFDIGIGGSGPLQPQAQTQGPISVSARLESADGVLFQDSFSSLAGSFATATWTTAHFSFVAASTTSTLSLTGLSRGPFNSNFIGLDNVSVAAAVPEPASCALLSSGLILLGALGRRRTA